MAISNKKIAADSESPSLSLVNFEFTFARLQLRCLQSRKCVLQMMLPFEQALNRSLDRFLLCFQGDYIYTPRSSLTLKLGAVPLAEYAEQRSVQSKSQGQV
jgi:hypothetical protein